MSGTPAQRFTRRKFLAGAAGAALAAASGWEAVETLGAGTASAVDLPLSYRTRPDLAPPRVRVDVPPLQVADGYVFVAAVTGPGQRGPMIVDNRGELVWFRPLASGTATCFRAQSYRGRPVLTWWQGQITSGYGRGEYVIADSSYRDVATVQAGNGLQGDLHEFLITAEGTALLTAYESIPANLSSVGGPVSGTLLESVVQEVDIASGQVLFEWRAADHVGLDETYAVVQGGGLDHFHVNSIDVDLDGNLLVSARHTWSVYKLDRRSGAIIWRLGGKKSDFALGPGATFAWQHDARRQPDGSITIFDDGDGPTQVEPTSRGIRLAVDETAKTAGLVHQYVHPDRLLAGAMGSMQRLPDGAFFVGWGTAAHFSEFGPSGVLRFDARLPGGSSYRAYRMPWTGRPTSAPALTVARVGGSRVLFASWNGATELAHWRLTGGRSRTALQQLAVVPREGFETRIPLSGNFPYLAVEGLDRSGRTLGQSRTLRV